MLEHVFDMLADAAPLVAILSGVLALAAGGLATMWRDLRGRPDDDTDQES